MQKIKPIELEIEDFFTLKDILIRAIEEFNCENQNESPIINLKGDPDMYKIRIGKKKTGLPNEDYPPLMSDKKIKNCKFPVLSIIYDKEHIDLENSDILVDNKNDILIENKKGLNEKLIVEEKENKNFDFNSSIGDRKDYELQKQKKCCDSCEIL